MLSFGKLAPALTSNAIKTTSLSDRLRRRRRRARRRARRRTGTTRR